MPTDARDQHPFFPATQPQRRISGQLVLVHPDGERVLLLDTSPRPRLWLPGGHAEPCEPPHHATRRHARRQLALDVPLTGADLAVIDYTLPKPERAEPEGFSFVFVRQLSRSRTAQLRPVGEDVAGYEWVSTADLAHLTAPHHLYRVHAALAKLTGSSAALTVAGLPAT
ncbi:NUDIX domain-containing protein [Kitasatospora sp. NPDC006697]|uniref:NUDIX domain-containing protein n=1 Tax=Kitasatospora sp. NPDC006697 TaxID=3364020 RepID=UPI003681E59D